MKTGVIIVAGGSGSRMGAQVPKQFLLLDGKPILLRSIEKFAIALPEAQIVVVLPQNELQRWDEICKQYNVSIQHRVCIGGKSRFESVRAGVAALSDVDTVAVHDAVRCLLSVEMIQRCIEVAQQQGSAIPVVAAVDSFRRVVGNGSQQLDRSELRAVQTPQVFHYNLLYRAYKQRYNDAFTDDASVVERDGTKITLCDGEQCNIKITTPLDMVIAESILKNKYGEQV